MSKKKIEELIGELRSWLPNYDHGPEEYPTVLYRILARTTETSGTTKPR